MKRPLPKKRSIASLFSGTAHPLKIVKRKNPNHLMTRGGYISREFYWLGMPKVKILEPKNHVVFSESWPFTTLHPEKERRDIPVKAMRFTGHSVGPLKINLDYKGKKIIARLETITLSDKHYPFGGFKILRAVLPRGVRLPLVVWDSLGGRITPKPNAVERWGLPKR
jgi:hypothetical protein